MTTLINSRKEIPNAPLYVLCNDTFMSNWGMSDNRINTIIIPCYNAVQADLVVQRIEAWRTDQNRVRIVYGKPKLNFQTHTYSLFNHKNAPSWYPGGKVQKIVWNGDTITIYRETGVKNYRSTLDRIVRLTSVLSTDYWHEFSPYNETRFTPRILTAFQNHN